MRLVGNLVGSIEDSGYVALGRTSKGMLTVQMDPNVASNTRAEVFDARSFGERIREWDHDLRGVAWSVVRTASATDDVMQDAYERAFRALETFDGRSSMKTWLYSIVYRTAIDHTRRERRRSHDDVDALVDEADVGRFSSPSTVALARLELDGVLDSCTPEQRSMLMLTAGLGYSFDETAEILGVRRGTVASRVSRLRSRLRRWEDE